MTPSRPFIISKPSLSLILEVGNRKIELTEDEAREVFNILKRHYGVVEALPYESLRYFTVPVSPTVEPFPSIPVVTCRHTS